MRLTVTPNEFADIVVCFLFDKVLKQDEVVSNNIMFNEFMEKMAEKGLKSRSMSYYLNLPSETRLNYKRIKNVFKDGSNIHEIRIVPEEKKEKEKKEKGGLIRKAVKIVKKLLKKEEVSKKDLNLLLETIEEEEKWVN